MPAVTLSPLTHLAPVPTTDLPTAAPSSSRRLQRNVRSVLHRLRRIARVSRRHGIWIAAWSLVGWIGTALAPVLTGQPLLLMMLSPRALFVALASNSVPLVPFVLLGTLRLGVTDASYFIIGRKLPHELGCDETGTCTADETAGPVRRRVRAVLARFDRLCRWFCARPRLAGAFLFFRPNGKYLGLAGAYGVNRWVAGLSATVGTACFLAAVHIGLAAAF